MSNQPSRVALALLLGIAAHASFGCSASGDRAASEASSRTAGAPARIVFHSQRDGDAEIYLMNGDGTDPVRVTFHSAADIEPDLSPDGRHIVFTSNRTGNDDIYVVPVSGGEPRNLTNTSARENWPRWSPDGRRIAFQSDRDGDPEIYVMNADGSEVTRLTQNPGPDLWPDWSPNGERLSFRRGQDVWVMNADGTGAMQLTNSPGLDQMASWSPDGERLAFMSLRGGYCSVFVMRADGSEQQELTPKGDGDANDQWCSRMPAWTPDGRILFMSRRPSTAGDEEIFVMNADGSGLARLTSSPGPDGAPRAR